MTQWFVTGTDTGVGKTLVRAALLHSLRVRHSRVVGMKPVAASAVWLGSEWQSEDALALRVASSIRVPTRLDNPVLLREPMSPHLAARLEDRKIQVAELVSRFQELAELAEGIVVEGAGGFLVPLNDEETGAELAQALGLPIVLVAGIRLECLNHALLTAEAIRSRGLRLAGWVANRIDPEMKAGDDNVAYLGRRLTTPLLADIPFGVVEPREVSVTLPPSWN